MPNYTENLQLEKPLQSEQYNVDVFNANADKIDQFAGQTPARALTADKLTTGAKINGVIFKGDTNVITGLGLHSSTEIYAQNNLAYKVIDDNVVVKRSLVNNNTGDNFGDSDYWENVALGGGSGYQLFDIVMKDHILTYEESLGLAPLGTYVYKEAIAGTRYGYPDFYAGVVAEYQDLNNTTDTVDSVTVTINANGHKFYDIADKATFDNMYAITGEAWYYGVDTTNERIFLPRSTRFKNGTTSDVGEYNPAGLPNITGSFRTDSGEASSTGCFTRTNISGTDGGGGTPGATFRFDASNSSNIYGSSTTVEYSSTKLIPYMVVGNQSTWAGMTDVVNQGMTILEQVANKATVDGSNMTNSVKNFDGEPVFKYEDVFSGTAVGSSSYSLGSYLPNDGYPYEILVKIILYSSATTQLAAGVVASPYTNRQTDFTVVGTTASGGTRSHVQCWIPIGTGRTLYYQLAGTAASSTSYVILQGYRRMGTNS